MFPDGFRLIEVEETASTNLACLDAARRDDPGNLWIRAERQTAGRGSRGRAWVSDSGNLFASLLLTDPGPAPSLANLTFVAALAVRDALGELASAHRRDPDIALKWPNDVLLNGGKVSGILLEHHSISGRPIVIVGIGINCHSHPEGTGYPATNLTEEGIAIPPRDMLELVAGQMAAGLKRWDRGANFADVRSSWIDRARGLGERIVVRLPSRELSGIFEDIDGQGHLVLRLDTGGTIAISAADVFCGDSQRVEV